MRQVQVFREVQVPRVDGLAEPEVRPRDDDERVPV
mgnify:FL=1